MSKQTSKIAAAAGISVGGHSLLAKQVESAMRIAALNGIATNEDTKATKEKMLEARFNAKPPERR